MAGLCLYNPVFAYDDLTTHPALTDEIVDFYNLFFDDKLTDDQKEWIIEGVMSEDTPPRWINHFYDPVYKVGWSGEKTGIWPALSIKYFSKVILSSKEPVSSLDWIHNQNLQAQYGEFKGNRTWERAIYEYASGNEKEAYYTLGFILHLVEDATVPDHTRNDTHAHELQYMTGDYGSPYEEYNKQFRRDTLDIAQGFKSSGYNPVMKDSIDEYIISLAEYSNKYFFSKDTINDPKYSDPKVVEKDDNFGYGKDENYEKFLLANITIFHIYENGEYKKIENYYLPEKDNDSIVLLNYFTRLSREAVINGAGVIDLFRRQGEEAKNNINNLKIPISDSSSVKSPVNKIIGVINSAINIYNNAVSGIKNLFPGTSIAQTSSVINAIQPSSQENVSAVANSVNNANQPVAAPVLSSATSNNLISLQYQLNQAQLAVQALQTQANNLSNQANIQNSQALAPAVTQNTIQALSSASKIQPTSIPAPGFGGGAPPATSSDPQSGVGTGDSQVQSVSASIEDKATSAGKILIIDADTEAPDISLFVLECENSLVSAGCLTSSAILNISWSSTADDLDYFITDTNGVFATTTATSTVVYALNNSIFSFGVSARDKAGNISATSTQTVSIFNSAVVINEVAWAGTQGHSSDEWIELYNNTDYDIPFDNWILEAEDGAPYIPLSGVIKAKDYYLIERSDDETVSDIKADLIAPFSGAGSGSGLSNAGETLILSYKKEGEATTTIDKMPDTNPLGWHGGSASSYQTMERIDSLIVGIDTENWGTNNGLMINGKNVDGNNITGTPKSKNSLSSLIDGYHSDISEDIVLTKAKSPYIVDNQWKVFKNGSSLTIEPGVVIKFYNKAGFRFENASLIANGTLAEPIIFTSFYDDEYGGDTNNDATSTSARPGSWFGVDIDSDISGRSVLDNTIFRYGGLTYNTYGFGNYYPYADLRVVDSSVVINNSIFEYSDFRGLELANSDASVTGNIFRDNNKNEYVYSGTDSAVLVDSGNILFKDNIIENNERGLSIKESPGAVDSNIFNSNTDEAIFATGNLPRFTGNSASGNRINGIVIYGDIAVAGSTTTLAADTLPYVMDRTDIAVPEDSALVIEKGAVMKSLYAVLKVGGNLVIDGEKSDDIVFTSLYDDTIFPATIADGTTTPLSAPVWGGIEISKTGSISGNGFTVRYAGSDYSRSTSLGGIYADESPVSIKNALFFANFPFGLRIQNSNNVEISDTEFKDHNLVTMRYSSMAALAIYNSSTTLTNLLFENNILGILSDAVSNFTADLINFIGNTVSTSPEGLF